jgi:DNA-binding transcriptional ArsR family regulator
MSESTGGDHSDAEYLDAVRAHEPAATSEVAAAVGVARQSADYRLRKLRNDGKVTSKRIGNSLAWSLAADDVAVREVDPDDAFWDAETYEGEAMSASDADTVVYGDVEPE